MPDHLRDLRVLVMDAQASGATPAHGDLLELGWAEVGAEGRVGPVHSEWVVPRTERRVSRAVRELTGWTPACIAEAQPEDALWAALRERASQLGRGAEGAPTLIHFARFELPFLRDVHARLAPDAAFPLDVLCLHAVAARLFPDLPRRNIRALAGHLGHAPTLLRRAGGHVEATAFIWRALLPLLARESVTSWDELRAWVVAAPPSKRRPRRVFPLASERRRALPDRPGVYRFVRRNGDVIYVGKATSLKRRVASHFSGSGKASERNLEMLTQVDDVVATETGSVLEAALLEVDEIKRIDPPYNVQLRGGERAAWFARRDLTVAVSAPDDRHRLGPLPSQRALSGLCALVALVAGSECAPQLRAWALSVPMAFGPDEALFREGFSAFAAAHLEAGTGTAMRRVDRASRALWLARGRGEPEDGSDEAAPDAWDLARVRRRLERTLVGGGLVARRARWLRLLADAEVAFREPSMAHARVLVIAQGQIAERAELPSVAHLATRAARRPRSLHARQAAFDAATYDRMRVLATELRRVRDEGGETAVRFGAHLFADARLAQLTCHV